MTVTNHHITTFSGDKTFIEIPFSVGQDIERIEVSYTFPIGQGTVVDIGLAKEGQSRGWTGSEYGHIWIAQDRAAAGYKPTPPPGEWKVVLGVVKIGADPFVDLSIRLVPKRGRWLAGELHSHTEHSDGGVLVAEAIARARNSRCDFVALTDHNATAQNLVRPDDPEILVIPGMELTSYWGHTNFLGLPDPVFDWRCYAPEDVPKKMAEARENGATIVTNHPFQNSAGGRWQVGFDVPFDAYEIWNGIWAQHNVEAVAYWQELLVSGRRIPITGGSDFHLKNRRRHGRPANRLWVEEHTIDGILAAVRAGSNLVCATPDELTLEPMGDTPMFGQDVATDQALGLAFGGLVEGDEVRIITADGVVSTIAGADLDQSGRQEIECRAGRGFTRVEVWNGASPRLFSNPFYSV